MSDATIQPKVYLDQGGDELVVANGGLLTIQAGGQLSNAGAITGLAKGSIFYVDSNAGNDNNDGTTWAKAMATLDAAIGLCTADRGDVIVIAAKHAETYSTTGTKVTIDIAGIMIIGLGSGADRPTFTFSHTGATWAWSAGGCTLANVLFITGTDSVTTFCTISGADARLEDIETRDTTDVECVDCFITTAAAERLVVKRHLHNGYTGGDANARVWKLVGVDRALFEDCRFVTKVTTAVVNFVTTACTGVEFRRCSFLVNSTTDFSKNVVDTVGGSSWAVEAGCFDIGAGQQFVGGSGQAVNSNGRLAGSSFIVQATITSSAIPNNTQTSGAFTGAASGPLLIESMTLDTDGTGVAGPTNIKISTDNAKGLTGVAAAHVSKAVSGLGANKTLVIGFDASNEVLPLVLESGKKLYIAGDDAGGSGAGTVRVTMLCRRIADGAHLAAGGIGS